MRYLVFMFFVMSCFTAKAQSKAEAIRLQDSTYQSNIRKSRINGVYIPKDMTEALKELDELSPAESKTKLRLASEDVIAQKLHFGLGRWMAHNWNFDDGSRFSHFLTGMNLRYSEDMIDFMLRMYHRHLSNKPLDAEKTAAKYQEARDKKYQEEMKAKLGVDSVIIKKW